MNVTAESRQSEEAPGKSELKFRLLFEKSPDAMLLLDGDTFVDCNQAAVKMMRCASKEQLLALCPYDISPERQPDGRLSVEKARELIDMAHRQGSLRFEWVHRRMDGQDFAAEVLLIAIPLPGKQILHVSLRDITERKRAEEALRESEANLRSLLENAANFVVYRVAIDASTPYAGRVVMVSPSIKEITGISDPYRFESWFETIHPEDLPRAVEANKRAWERGEPYSQQVRVYHPQKEQWIWVHTASTPVFDAQGNLTHFNGLIIDITEQKRAEEELEEREAQFRGIFESTSDAVLIFDFDGTIVEANPAACRIYGYTYEELVGLSGKDIVHPDYCYLFEDYKRQVKASGRFSAQSVDLRQDGTPINVEVHGASFSYKGKPHLLAAVRDVTERVQARQALEQRVEERTRELQTLLDVTAAASSSLELDEMLSAALDCLVALVGASRAGVMLLDSDSGELEPRMLRPEQPIAADDLAAITPACHAVIAGGEPLYVPPDPEKGFLEPGALLPLRVRGQALGILVIIGPQGSTFSEGHLALFESIADQLGVAVENARLYEQAEQAAVVAERSRLARDLHDAVTQTLFSASLIAEVLPRIWERHPEEGKRRLEELRELTRGALAEMRTLLLELRPSALVDAALSDLLRQLAESITGRARVPVSVEVEDECPLPPEVKVALYRIAQEALNNVAKHAGAGQAAVSLHYIPPACGGDRGGAVELRVSDDGRGFDPQSVPPESLGLGIMRERAEAIGAALNVDSEVGHGTQVVVVWKGTGGEEQP